MQVDVVDVLGVEAAGGQGLGHRCACAQALGVRRRHVMRVARFPNAEQQNRVALKVLLCIGCAFQQRKGSGLANGDAIPRDIARPAWLLR